MSSSLAPHTNILYIFTNRTQKEYLMRRSVELIELEAMSVMDELNSLCEAKIRLEVVLKTPLRYELSSEVSALEPVYALTNCYIEAVGLDFIKLDWDGDLEKAMTIPVSSISCYYPV